MQSASTPLRKLCQKEGLAICTREAYETDRERNIYLLEMRHQSKVRVNCCWALILAISALNQVVYGQTSRPQSVEQVLFKRLLADYDKKARPVYNSSQAVNISLGISLNMISDIDERNQVLATNVWLDQSWTDPRLTWDPADYGNFSKLRIPSELLWLPDIVLYNSVEDQSRTYHKSLAMVSSSGDVFWPPIVRFMSSCKLDITFFPFDDQICSLKLGSWAYDGLQLDVFKLRPNIELGNLVSNGEWDVHDTRVVKNVVYYPCCQEPFPDISFYIHIRRRNLYYTLNIIVPCMFLSMLTLSSFALPPDSGEKVTLGLTILLAYSVFMLLIAENMPPTSEYTPLIGVYLTVVMGLTSFSVVFAVLVLNLHHRGVTNRRPPPLLYRLVTRYLGRAVCVSRSNAELFSRGSVSVFPTSRRSTMRRASILVEGSIANCSPVSEVDQERGGHSQMSTMMETEISCNAAIVGNSNGSSVRFLTNQHARGFLPSTTAANQHRPTHLTRLFTREQQPHSSMTSQMAGGGSAAANQAEAQATILGHLRQMSTKQERIEEEAACIREWQLIAYIIDRLLLICFVGIVLVSTTWLLLFKPMLKNLSIEAKDSVMRLGD